MTKREGHTGEYWCEVVEVRSKRSDVRTKSTEGQCFSRSVVYYMVLRPNLFILNYPTFSFKITWLTTVALETKYQLSKEPIRTLGFASRLP